MKYAFLITIIAGVLIQSITKTIVLVNHTLNQEYISKNLCEKRNVKNNKCKGACHLKLKLKQSDENDSKEPPLLKDKTESVLYCSFSLWKLNVNTQQDYLFPVPVRDFPQPLGLSVFHPPQSIS